MSRARTMTLRCTWAGCREYGLFEYENQREAAGITSRRTTYRCSRHRNDGRDVLGPDNPLTTVWTVVQSEHGNHKFWHDGGKKRSGYVHGPGFQGWADDFPVGTALTVSATVSTPQMVASS